MLKPQLINLVVCLLLGVSIVDASQKMAALVEGQEFAESSGFGIATEEGRAKHLATFLNDPSPKVFIEGQKLECNASVKKHETATPDKLLMRNAIFIYRNVIRIIIDAYNTYQTEKKAKVADQTPEETKQIAGENFAKTISLYMVPLIQFANNFDAETIEEQAGKIIAHESSKGKWNKIKKIIKGTVKVACVTLAVMSLNIPALAGTVGQISTAISETITAFTDAKDGVEDTIVGEYLKKTYTFGKQQIKKLGKAMTSEKQEDKDAVKIDRKVIIKVFETMLEQNKLLVAHYYEVVEFEGLTEKQRVAAQILSEKIFWIQAPEDHNAKLIKELKENLKQTLNYVHLLHSTLNDLKIFVGKKAKKLNNHRDSMTMKSDERRRLSINQVMDRLLQADSQ